MIHKHLTQACIVLALLFGTGVNRLYAQVTLGSAHAPNKGALLDLKQESTGYSIGGLAMPRVKLLHATIPNGQTSLASTIDQATGDWNDQTHIGLVVYHVDECTIEGQGLYVWTGKKWDKLSNGNAAGITFSNDTLFIPSGHDLRETQSSYTFDVSWNPSGELSYTPTWQLQTEAGTNALVPSSLTPASGSLSNSSPQTMTLVTPPIEDLLIASNIFYTQTRKVEFSSGICADVKKSIILNQTNKALLVNGSAKPNPKHYVVMANNEPLTITSNAPWNLTITPKANAAVSVQGTIEGNVQGEELNNNSKQTVNIKYNVLASAGDQRYNYLTFSDARTPKRFEDVTQTISQCASYEEMTMEEWKNFWEDNYGLDPDNDEPNSIGNASKNPHKVMWHRDQNGNVFFSAIFGSEGRWMTSNLAATSYADNAPSKPILQKTYTPSDETSLNACFGYPNPKTITDPSDDREYNKRQRLGLLYNWAAATGASNSSTGNQGTTTHGPVQGICPDHWYLASNKEWTNLLNIFISNPTDYSSNTITGVMNTEATVKDMCEQSIDTGKSFGLMDGGFNLLLAGEQPANEKYIFQGFYWTSSSKDLNHACHWEIGTTNYVNPSFTRRNRIFSVRCKSDGSYD